MQCNRKILDYTKYSNCLRVVFTRAQPKSSLLNCLINDHLLDVINC